MKRTISSLSLLLVMAFGCFAQTAMTSTTNTPALTATTKSFAVASATNITGPLLGQSSGGVGSSSAANLTVLYIDREAMDVLSVSGTTVTVKRGTRGTAPAAHLAASKVWVGAAGLFTSVDPSGACTRTLIAYLPRINIANGKIWDCDTQWSNFTDSPALGTVIASQAGVMTGAYAVLAKVTHISGTNAITGFAVPAGLAVGNSFSLIPDAAFTVTNATNVSIASTAVVGKTLTYTWDGTKLNPNY